MSAILYEAEIDVKVGQIRLNGVEGAVQAFANEEAWEECDEIATFESAEAAYDFIDQFERALADAGFHRAEDFA
jgi:hypothetical protein